MFSWRKCRHGLSLLAGRHQRLNSLKPVLRPLCAPLSTSSSTEKDDVPAEKIGFLDKYIGKKSCEARPEFRSRWLMAIPAFATHMCIGSPWAWSIMGDIVTKEIGFVAPVAADWTLAQSCLPLSLVFVFLGGTAAALGPWQSRVGHRTSLLAAAGAFGGGLALGSVGIHLHSLPLLYAGYGAMAGLGLGLAYTPCISTLMQWFPDKKGTASGITIAGFGSGALVFTPLVQKLTRHFAQMPEYLGPAEDFTLQTIEGKMFVDLNGTATEVVHAVSADIAKLAYSLPEGLYVVGSGSTGAAEALAVCAAGYFGVMMAAALALKTPHSSYAPDGMSRSGGPSSSVQPVSAIADVAMPEAIRSPQFHLLGVTFTCIAMGGMGIFSVAKPMMSEVFSGTLPDLVTSAFAAQFLLCLSLANLGGRLGWAAISDAVGRRNLFYVFTLSSIPLYLSIPHFVDSAITNTAAFPVYAFIGSTVGAISIMGGTYAILPAYEADLFGAKNVGATHGVMMIYSATAALLGPSMLLQLRQYSERSAISDLMTKVSADDFLRVFGAPMDQAMALIESKSLTVAKLLTIAPYGTVDPTPHLYDSTMYTLAGLMIVASLAHASVRFPYIPVAARNSTIIDVQGVDKKSL